MRDTGQRFGEFVPAVPHRVRKQRPHPSLPRKRGRVREGATIFLIVCAVYFAAQRPHAIMVARVEDPDAPLFVPYSTEAAGSCREIWVVRTSNCDAAIRLFNDRQRHAMPRCSTPIGEFGAIRVNIG